VHHSQSIASKFLKLAGNERAWSRLVEEIRVNKKNLVLVSGPYGCGKTRGVHDVANSTLGMNVYEINSSTVMGIEETVRKIVSVCRTRTLMGSRMVLLDDIEGFDETYVEAFVSMIKSRTSEDGVLVITCHDPYDRKLFALRNISMSRIKLFAPSPQRMADAAVVLTSEIGASALLREAHECDGNFHQLVIRLTFLKKKQSKLTMQPLTTKPDTHVGLFATTQNLLCGETNVETWIRSADPGVLTNLLHQNAPTLTTRGDNRDSMKRLGLFIDLLSETWPLKDDIRMHAVGIGVRQALFTPKDAIPPLQIKGMSFTKRNISRVELDTPSLLQEYQKSEIGF
jgi:hypothetical protein